MQRYKISYNLQTILQLLMIKGKQIKKEQTISVQSQRSQKKVNQLSDSRQSIPVEQDNLFRRERQQFMG
jgi:hypothetical protein